MGGHHKVEVPEVPDYRLYAVEDAPALARVQKRLADIGLSDPWLRNHVWRYTEGPMKAGIFKKFSHPFKLTMKYGLIAAVITSGIEMAFFPLRKAPTYDDEGHH